MASLFGPESNVDSTSENQSESSSTSSKKAENRPKGRPCIIWKTSPTIQVLVMSKFDGKDVSDPDVQLFDHLSREYVLKRLITVAPKVPYGNRRSICAATKNTNTPIRSVDTNLILIPTVVENCQWKTAQEYFPPEELQYISQILLQIAFEEHQEEIKFFPTISYPQLNNSDLNNQEDDNSSSASSLPKPRTEVIEYISRENKNNFVNEWLSDGQSK